jgi:hypothetical protein
VNIILCTARRKGMDGVPSIHSDFMLSYANEEIPIIEKINLTSISQCTIPNHNSYWLTGTFGRRITVRFRSLPLNDSSLNSTKYSNAYYQTMLSKYS